VGKAKKLKALRRELRENMSNNVQMQAQHHVIKTKTNGIEITHTTFRHKPSSMKGTYKQMKKNGVIDE